MTESASGDLRSLYLASEHVGGASYAGARESAVGTSKDPLRASEHDRYPPVISEGEPSAAEASVATRGGLSFDAIPS